MDIHLATSIQYLPGVGPKRAELLNKLGIFTVKDLIYHVPFRYNDFSIISPIKLIQPGETVTIKGKVVTIKNFNTKTGKRIQQALVMDDTGTIVVTWFNQTYLLRVIQPLSNYYFSGMVSWFGSKLTIMSPEYEVDLIDNNKTALHTGRLVPIYHETEGISSKWLRVKIDFALKNVINELDDYLPEIIQKKYDLISLDKAINIIHYPKSKNEADLGRTRLAFDELFSLQLRSYLLKRIWETSHSAPVLKIPLEDLQSISSSLPFELTQDQKKAINDISQDLAKAIPMNRLLEGDVGAGKTVVAAIASYISFRCGYSSIFMTPTQILANQHFDTIKQFLSTLHVPVVLVTGNNQDTDIKIDQSSMSFLPDSPSVYVGTHALMYADFHDAVGLVIVDEQQKFGVEQRTLIREKGLGEKTPHLLTMTATPIPRTVALTYFGNLSLSVINELPKGRKKVKTWVVNKEKRTKAYEWIQKQIEDLKIQAFILCPFIEESKSMNEVKAVKKEFDMLKKNVFPNLSLGMLHGKMTAKEKVAVLESFRNHKFDILVTTPVVEVGVDIPNAAIILIEAADRFGLSQLHQLRGRVGRRDQQSYCLLFTENEEVDTIKRLKAMETIHNGPKLAEFDLSMRGPGDMFGKRQHGSALLKIASFFDLELIDQTKKAVEIISKIDSDLNTFPHLREIASQGTIIDISQD